MLLDQSSLLGWEAFDASAECGAGAFSGEVAPEMRMRHSQVATERHHTATVWLFWFVFHRWVIDCARKVNKTYNNLQKLSGQSQNCKFLKVFSNMTFAEKLDSLMHQEGLSHERLGKAVGKSHVAVGDWLKGAKPRAATMTALADYFDLPVEVLADDRVDLPPERSGYMKLKKERAIGSPVEPRRCEHDTEESDRHLLIDLQTRMIRVEALLNELLKKFD